MEYKGVFLFGSSSDLVESSFSSILRILESFDLNSINILYSPFAKKKINNLKILINELQLDNELKISYEIIDESMYEKQFKELFDERTILCPTSGSRFYTIIATMIAFKNNSTIVHTLFPYGAWTGMFYPFVPRYLQTIKVIGGSIKPNLNVSGLIRFTGSEIFNNIASEKFHSKPVTRRVGGSALEINMQDSLNYTDTTSYPDLSMGMLNDGSLKIPADNEKCFLKLNFNKKNFRGMISFFDGNHFILSKERDTYKKYMEELLQTLFKRIYGDKPEQNKLMKNFSLKDLMGIFGFIDIFAEDDTLNKKELEEITEGKKGILVDTNLVYLGILFHKNIKKLIPYCTYVEIANKRAEKLKKDSWTIEFQYANLLWDSLLELVDGSQMLHTEAFFCDGVIPMIDPLLIKNCIILTEDEGAYNHWQDIFSQGVNVMKALTSCTSNRAKITFAFLLLSSFVKEINNKLKNKPF